METADLEILVHISAPSRARDDKRFIALAHAVQNFVPAIITKVSGFPRDPASPASLAQLPATEEDAFTVNERRTALRPNLPRPRTAPNLVSAAESASLSSLRAKRRRTFAETALDNESFSQPQPSSIDKPDPSTRSPQDPTPHSPSNRNLSRKTPPSGNSRQRQENACMRGLESENARTHLPPSLAPSADCPHLDRRFQSQAANEDDDSTQSISPSYLWPCGKPITTDLNPIENSRVSVVDLTTSQRHASCSYPTPTSTPEDEVRFEAAEAARSPPENRSPREAGTSNIQQRPNEARPKRNFFPPKSLPKFTTHITPLLAKVTARAGLNEFRPAFIARDVRVSERGYWQFFVRLAARGETIVPRQPAKPSLRLLGSTIRGRRNDSTGAEDLLSICPSKGGRWTEDELVFMWDHVTKFIERGKVGLDTWAVKESTDGILWRIRLFTWGEILAHIWFLLFTFSNKLTGEMSMDWIAGDGEVVVQMSPGKNLDGVWQAGGPEGEAGVWRFVAAESVGYEYHVASSAVSTDVGRKVHHTV